MISQVVQIGASRIPDMVKVTGYAAVLGLHDKYGGPEHGGFIESIDRQVFVHALQSTPDMHLLVDGTGVPLARTRTGSLRLLVDHLGLQIEADVPAADADRLRDGTLGYSSVIRREDWNEPRTLRVVRELSLHKCAIDITSVERAARIAALQDR